MRYILLSIMCASLVVACDQTATVLNTETEDRAKLTSSNNNAFFSSSPNPTITPQNSYSDLFLDSVSIERYLSENKIQDSTANNIRSFYNKRNYQFAWFNSNGFTEQGRGFWNLYHHTHQDKEATNKKLLQKMDTLIEIDTLKVTASDSSYIATELALTRQFINYVLANNNSGIFSGISLYQFIPEVKVQPMAWADSLLNKQEGTARTDSSTKATAPYQMMKQKLRDYYTIAQNGGWGTVSLQGKSLRKGAASPSVVAIKKRLQATGEYTGADTSNVYNDSLEVAIKAYQQRHGMHATGIITDSVVKAMNVPVERRLEQIIINMNRMAWMPAPSSDRIISVNIPEYMLYVHENGSRTMDMQVVVGKQGATTMMFNGNLNQIVFSPHWNIPEEIVKEKILPAMKSDPSYLKKNNMEVVKQNDSLPTIRQLPGDQNALGKVKFLFPNSHDIILHDSPNKELFARDKRAFSNGCIRLADAEKMAVYLLQDNQSWTREKIRAAMNSNKEQYVSINKPVPVIISYYTAWVDEDGQLNFRDDVYGHDMAVAQRMFTTSAYNNVNGNIADSSIHKKDSAKL
ncbi:MAG TPA: L,D-transpeptidase family protein [Chitinophagaceae bacterium]|nr:L,D-transpeptidase family protein [Chitinophagaceae bacterium]